MKFGIFIKNWLLLRILFIITIKSDKLVKEFGNVCDNQKNLATFTKILVIFKNFRTNNKTNLYQWPIFSV